MNFSILKYEQVWEGDWRKLLVKNITKDDMSAQFFCEARGEKCGAKLMPMSPWLQNKMEDAQGYIGDIAVFETHVRCGTQVNWYIGNQKINRQNFRLVVSLDPKNRGTRIFPAPYLYVIKAKLELKIRISCEKAIFRQFSGSITGQITLKRFFDSESVCWKFKFIG